MNEFVNLVDANTASFFYCEALPYVSEPSRHSSTIEAENTDTVTDIGEYTYIDWE